MEWTEDMIARLRVLWEEGRPTAEIGRVVGISKNAVVGKAHRLSLTPRPSPIRRETALAPQAPQTVPEAISSSPAAAAAVVPVAPVAGAAAAKVVPAPLSLAARRTRAGRAAQAAAHVVACCWPIGEPATPGFHFCGAAALPGKPYCAAHAALAYIRVRDRREDAA